MTFIRSLQGAPEPSLAESFDRFELQFRYPLGEDRWFRISHGEDYTRFFRAIGESRTFIAQRDGEIVGVISVARTRVDRPDGSTVEAAYFADLKLVAGAGGKTLLRLLQEPIAWARESDDPPAFSIVMDGTPRSPDAYTGRLGIPEYAVLSRLVVLRIPCQATAECGSIPIGPIEAVNKCRRRLAHGRYRTVGGTPDLRSAIRPIGLVAAGGTACGMIEDTRKSKRLFDSDGQEMVSAHLSNFAYQTIGDAVTLLNAAVGVCASRGIPALFVCFPALETMEVLHLLGRHDIVQAPATVYGYGFPAGGDWWVNTAEI